MKKSIILLIHLLVCCFSYGQSNVSINFNSKSGTRIYDGFLLDKEEDNPKGLAVNNRLVFSAVKEQENIGELSLEKPHVFLNSDVTDLRSYIYNKAKIGSFYITEGFNIPIVLNGTLLTFNKYYLLNNVDKAQIVKANFVKKPSSKSTPLGVIAVDTH